MCLNCVPIHQSYSNRGLADTMSRRGLSIKKQKLRTELGRIQDEQTIDLITSIRRSSSFPEELMKESHKSENHVHFCNDENNQSKQKRKSFVDENRNRMKSSGQLQTALMTLSICDGDTMQLWRLLSRRGVDVNYVDGLGMQPIHYASLYGNVDILKILLQFNVNVNAVTEKGETALEIAVREGNFEIAQCLIKNGAKVKTIVNGMKGVQDEKRVDMIRRNSSCDLFQNHFYEEDSDSSFDGLWFESNRPRKAVFEI